MGESNTIVSAYTMLFEFRPYQVGTRAELIKLLNACSLNGVYLLLCQVSSEMNK